MSLTDDEKIQINNLINESIEYLERDRGARYCAIFSTDKYWTLLINRYRECKEYMNMMGHNIKKDPEDDDVIRFIR